MIEQYIKFCEETNLAFKDWTKNLIKEALKQGTYQKAINWLKKNKPELKGFSNGTLEDQLESIVRTTYDDAIHEVYKLALKEKVNNE